MLEEFDDLIATLCANSSIVREERDGRLFFTIDGILFDSFWYSTDNRWSRGRQSIERAADLDSLQASWTVVPGQLSGEQVLSMRSCPDVEFTSFDEQRAYRLAHLMQYPFEDALQLYLGE